MKQDRSIFIVLAIFGFLFLVTSLSISADSSTEGTQESPSDAKLSHVRVVRLSFIEGTVKTRRAASSEWSTAMLNTPIQEGFSVATKKGSFAEVEFENGSTVRIGELSAVDFTQLALTPEGGHTNHLTLDSGYATFNVIPAHHDEYVLNVGGISLESRGKTEFRTDFKQDGLRVEVFDGHVQASAPNYAESLGKNHTLVRGGDSDSAFQVTDNIQKDNWDKWVDSRQQQSSLAVNSEAISAGAPIYGWDDLNVYGEWSYLPGYGNGWMPYEPAGWSPYSTGMWDWYQGMGYTWISGEPWGWLPFHYGYWNFSPGAGWFWMPGSFGAWRPALVNWYSGPGWIGWSPIGVAGMGGHAPCTLAVSGCLTALAPNALASGQSIRPGAPYLLHPVSIEGVTAIARPTVVPNLPTAASGVAKLSPGRASVLATDGTRSPGRLAAAAPSSMVMGREVSTNAFVGRRSTFGNVFNGREPIHVRLGNTMGGQFPVMRNDAGDAVLHHRSTAGPIRGGPQILSRRTGMGYVSGAYASHGGGSTGVGGSGSSIGGGAPGGGSHSAGSSDGGHR